MGSLRFIDRTNLGGKPRLSYIRLIVVNCIRKGEDKTREIKDGRFGRVK